MNKRNILLTGIQRSGTTLVCHLLNKVQNTIALHEPLPVVKMARKMAVVDFLAEVDGFFRQSRQTLLSKGVAQSRGVQGRVPDNPFSESYSNETGLRRCMAGDTEDIVFHKDIRADMFLIVKHTAAFTALIGSLVKSFSVYAIIRNPLSVLLSWQTCDMQVNRGRMPAAEMLSEKFRDMILSEGDRLTRQIKIIHWFFQSYQEYLPQDQILRYEQIIASKGSCLSVIVPDAQRLNEPLLSKNTNPLYPAGLYRELGDALLASEGAAWRFYDKAEVEAMIKMAV